MGEASFLGSLYDELIGVARNGTIVSDLKEEIEPEGIPDAYRRASVRVLGWRWIIHGDRERWWLEVIDDRPPMEGRPYYIDPPGDKEFFELAQHANLITPDQVRYYMFMLITHMDEKLVGQAEAHRAYSRARPIEGPPWIHTDSAG